MQVDSPTTVAMKSEQIKAGNWSWYFEIRVAKPISYKGCYTFQYMLEPLVHRRPCIGQVMHLRFQHIMKFNISLTLSSTGPDLRAWSIAEISWSEWIEAAESELRTSGMKHMSNNMTSDMTHQEHISSTINT